MTPFDLHHEVQGVPALATATISSNTTTIGIEVDTANFHALEFFVQSGTVTDGDFALSIQESDVSGSGYTAASMEETLGAGTAFAAGDDGLVKRIGYIGKKRYAQLVITSTGVSSGGAFSAVGVLGSAFNQPVSDD
ncbi:MAG: hypothetical protein AAF360_02185 [Pseudomonadota bacterium]